MTRGGPALSSEGIRTAPVRTGDAGYVTFIICPEFSLVCFLYYLGKSL